MRVDTVIKLVLNKIADSASGITYNNVNSKFITWEYYTCCLTEQNTYKFTTKHAAYTSSKLNCKAQNSQSHFVLIMFLFDSFNSCNMKHSKVNKMSNHNKKAYRRHEDKDPRIRVIVYSFKLTPSLASVIFEQMMVKKD